LRGSGGAIEQLLGLAFELEPRVLVGLVARDGGDALDEIEDALCQGPDYAEPWRQALCR